MHGQPCKHWACLGHTSVTFWCLFAHTAHILAPAKHLVHLSQFVYVFMYTFWFYNDKILYAYVETNATWIQSVFFAVEII